MSDTPRIAIVGAGPGGLVCARILHNHGVPVTVLERETGPTARPQGGMLDIQAPTGQVALRAAGLFDGFLALSRPEGQEVRMMDRDAVMVRHFVPDAGDLAAPEIDRGHLRTLLLDSLAPGTVRWGHAVETTTALPDGTVRLGFSSGRSEIFDLVVGADGAWSRVRPALTGAEPVYSGVTFVEIHFDNIDHRQPDLARLIGPGTFTAKAGRLSLVAQRNSNAHVRVYIAFRGPLDWNAGLDPEDTDALRDRLLKMYEGWDESLLALIRRNEGPFVNRPVFVLPVPHTWQRVPGITLLGDAAHLMPPAGVGANLAMLDGAELAQAVIDHPTIEQALDAYEAVMLARSVSEAERTGEMLTTLMPDTDSIEPLFPIIRANRAAETGDLA
ncbi:putative monooxygenase [[Actinomadura] parvosata subsp. kistnae]|uniref:Flavin-dependent monooxygenase n=1 Tax=[Actinomadura] parvosata subsp. kistnae TaxID=1909395 RepID=A0A1U9ZX59_9ACTN|nr:NAD(P)/FAD-dependent oxidoreductase [Nonomuraea sp. ATCC 55076]AQZ62541.1 FAD-dependent oxidoreductase [Nonomuraea sp. ATCC 55076]SPL88805.1 putative monooxygenase [Actinomadura parvosata subsp. kistnae]